MERTVIAFVLITLSAIATSLAADPPAGPALSIKPPLADRLFPYITYDAVWQGTPAHREDVAVPNVSIVYGVKEDPRVVAEAGKLAFYLGNWVEDIGIGVAEVKSKSIPRLLVSEAELPSQDRLNLIVVGTKNGLVTKHGVAFDGPGLRSIEAGGRRILFVGGKTGEETIRAARYLADVRVNFKGGAYKTFFAFIALRGYLEASNWAAAMEAIESPIGLSACGRNMALAAPMAATFPPEAKAAVKHRNQLLYKGLPEAVRAGDKEKAVTIWKGAMATCYGCHQGAGEVPKLRKFTPIESIHDKHQRVAARFDGLDDCTACHAGPTEARGY